MKKNLYLKVLGGALAVALTGAVRVVAQDQTRELPAPAQAQQQATEPNNKSDQTCPMMESGGGKMNMSMMMDCCKKMGMNMERPESKGNTNSKQRPGSNQ